MHISSGLPVRLGLKFTDSLSCAQDRTIFYLSFSGADYTLKIQYNTGRKNTMTNGKYQSRREFIKRSAVTGAGLALGGGTSFGEVKNEGPPFVTCRKDRKLVGVYCSPYEVMEHPEYIDALQTKLGCNVIALNAEGVTYPDEIRRLYPLPPEVKQSIGPAHVDNDEPIHRCAEILHGRGMDMWLVGSGHADLGYDDSISPVDFDGIMFRHHRVPKYAIESATGLCFQKERILRWQIHAYPWICANYDIDALYLTHHRYNIPSIYSRLWGCACEECQAASSRLGIGSQTCAGHAQARQGTPFIDTGASHTDCRDRLFFYRLSPDDDRRG